jgi:uncharacterized protein YceH (UPF0502 family)
VQENPMSDEIPTPTALSSGPWPVLDREERRVLGVLIEKQKTTPDTYPMSLNGVVTGCNQKSNRDPVMELSEPDVEDTLEACFKKGLVTKVIGGRVEKWRHLLYDIWHVGKKELAILAELLLRGPQTEGELRGRASRMEAFDDLEALRAVLKPLVERNLVVYLTPEDRRGAVLTHGFHDTAELEVLKRTAGQGDVTPARSATPERAPATPPPQFAQIEAAIASLTTEVTTLRERVQTLEGEVARLKQALGS